jgi:hypothetical protein
MPLWDTANPQLKNLVAYEPGKPIDEVARELGLDPSQIVKLASNENPLGPSPKAKVAMAAAMDQAHIYPDGGGYRLRHAIAEKFGIDLVMYGENQAEYGNSISENKDPKMDQGFFTTEDPSSIVLGGLSIKEIIQQTNFSMNDFSPYMPISKESQFQKSLEVHYLGYYLKWDPQECYYYAVENTGFNSNDQRTEGSYSKYSSIDEIGRAHV